MVRAWVVSAALVCGVALGSWVIRAALRPKPAAAQAGLTPQQRTQLETLQRRLQQDSTDLGAVLELANFYYDLGRFADAVPLYQRYLRADPGQAEVRIDYAYALFASGAEEAGIAELRRVLERFPDHPIALFNLGVLLAQRGELEAARQSFRELIRLHPTLPISQRAQQALRMLDSLEQSTTTLR